ncbi:MAG: VWA domain-containing protein [Dehalococcoidales bacterium]|nr:MAG: VWA domain-containing protein [Dehalococcoidales bacterium]
MKRSMKKHFSIYPGLIFLACVLIVIITGCTSTQTSGNKIDDWEEEVNTNYTDSVKTGRSRSQVTSTESVPPIVVQPTKPEINTAISRYQSDTIGFSAGGAKDIMNFRENIRNDYLPLPTDITYEGLFYDYYFDTGESEMCNELFCPAYSYALTDDPFSGKQEYYLSVGLNSGMKESDFKRKKLNLVIVLDISGSMKSPFDVYYYDNFGNRQQIPAEEANTEKIEIATESIVALLDHLNEDDLFGMVLFNNNARIAKPLNPVEITDMDAIKDHILEITAHGGTHLSAGMEIATGLFEELTHVNLNEYENRIIFLTDAMPNIGETSSTGLLGMTEDNAGNRIHTTFIGIGLDFNTELVEHITKIRGANYYSVHSAEQFRERMNDEFEYMVTPLVFDLQLTLESDDWKIEEVYGSPEADEVTGELMKVNTLFPSKKKNDETRGGIILLKLTKTGDDNSLSLVASYEDRNGKEHQNEVSVELDEVDRDFFENRGIRKGILLSRYADLLINWMIDEREHAHYSHPWEPRIDEETGICIPPRLNQWERQSLPLTVAEPYGKLFGLFYTYYDEEIENIGDDDLQQELDILDILKIW